MRYALGITAGAVAGGVCAVVGAVVALVVAATADVSGLTVLFSAAGVLAALPVVFIIGAVLGGFIGWLLAHGFR